MSATEPPSPSIAVIGAGAMGGFVAARLALAGKRVLLCARGRVERLLLDAGGERHVASPRIVADPAAAERVDWVLLATKAQDTAGAAPWLARLCDAKTTLVVLQNGIDHEARAAPVAYGATVLPALVNIGAERIAPGHIVQHGGGFLIIPEGEVATRLAGLLKGSGIAVTLTADFITEAWRKLLGNIFANPLTALTLRRLDVLRDPAIQEVARGLLDEAVAAGRACGAKLPRDQAERTLAEVANYPSQGGTSMLYDRLAGRPLEHEHLTGAVVRAAASHGIAVPLNRAILALLAALSEGSASGSR